jgi:predicted RNase H-like nuclease (RuvC/YqgF family)
MTNYDTEIRRIADEVRHILNNCTDAPRLLREYAGLYMEGEVDQAVEAATTPLEAEIDALADKVTDLKDDLRAAEQDGEQVVRDYDRKIDDLEDTISDLRDQLERADELIDDLKSQLQDT